MTLKTDILRILNGLRVPSFIVDKDGRILHSNSEGESIRQEYQDHVNISDLFTPEDSGIIKLKVSESIEFLRTLTTGSLSLAHGIRGRNEAGLSISSFEDETRSAYAVCTFYFQETEKNSERFEFNFSSKEYQEIIKDEALLKIFDEVKSSFPFTFLGKSRIQNEINRLDEFFWLKDAGGRYILVNLLFSQFLGLKPGQIEGKYEKDFVPGHFNEMLLSVDKYIKETANTVIRNGFPLYQLNGETSRIIELPLCDLDNKVIAILGVSQKNFSADTLKENNSELIENALKCLPKMVIIADKEGIVKSISGELPALKTPGLNPGMPLSRYLPRDLGPEAERFFNGGTPLDKLELKKEITLGTRVIPFVFHFRKIYNYRGKLEGFLLFIEEDNSFSGNSNTIGNKEKMYEILMQTSPEPMFIYDIENLRFLDVNQAALQVYGYSRHEFLQMDLTDLYAPEDIQTLLDTSSSRNKEGVFTGPWRHRKKDGSSLLVEISRSTFDYQGKKAHFNIVRDVTQKAELEKNSQFFNAAFNTISDLIFITDPEGFITKVNDSVTKVLGYSKAELDMRPFLTLASDSYRAEINTSIFYSKAQKPVSLDAELKKSDGSILEVSLVAIPVFDYDEQVSSFSVVVRTKQALYNSSNREAEVYYTGNTKPSGTEDALTKKPNSSIDPGFLSSMFHEILTPMNVILGFIQELTENIESPTPEQKESIDIINQNRTLLMQTMDSVLEYSHIEQNRVEVNAQRVFFTEIVDDLQKDLSRIMSENKIMFNYGKISTSLNFETDRHRMESFLAMFIKMAMRITKEGSIFISAYQYDDQYCLISLKDRRNSISPYLLENIAELFTSEEQNIKKDFGVSKLTIRLVRRLLGLLLGKVEVVKRSGEPSEFGFLFPLVYKKPDGKASDDKGDETQTSQSAHPEENLSQDKTEKRNYTSHASIVNEEDMDIIEEGEILDGLEEALNQDEPVKVFDPDVKEAFSGTVTAPRAKAEEKPHPKPSGIDPASLQCLYVEDQVDSQILFRVQMKDLKHVDSVASFEAALPLLEENKYDFIVMDINLQGEYNGLDALRIIRRLPGYRKVPIIAVTAYILAGDKEKFIAAGFNGFISKPVMRDKVMETLEKII